jgi:hypothetical protein
MKRSTGPPIASVAGAPKRRSAALLKSTTLPSASTVMTPSLTASTRPVMRTSPWRSAVCMCSRSVMSKKVATEPCRAPSSRIGCDQYSTGKAAVRRKEFAGDMQFARLAVRAAMRESAAFTPFGGR